jgi:hypothetical protein
MSIELNFKLIEFDQFKIRTNFLLHRPKIQSFYILQFTFYLLILSNFY